MAETLHAKVAYVPDGIREFGENGAALKLMLEPGGEAEVTTNRSTAPKLLEHLKTLVGKEVDIAAEKTEYGLKVSKDYRFPGDPRGAGGGGRGNRGPGDWQTHAEREWSERAMVWMSVFKSLCSIDDSGQVSVEELPGLANVIYDKALEKLGPYPAKAAAPVSNQPGQPVAAPQSGGVQGRIGELLEAVDNDSMKVVEAKRFAMQQYGVGDLDALDDEQWAHVLATIVLGGGPADDGDSGDGY